MIRAEMVEFTADTCGGIVGIDLPAHCLFVCLSFYLTFSLCLCLCCRFVREEERPEGL